MSRKDLGTSESDWHPALKLGKRFIGVSLLTLCISAPAFAQFAQDSVYVDVSDPNIMVDLSVLDDGGKAPVVALRPTVNNSRAVSHRAGPQNMYKGLPISTLYIQPTHSRNLPPQTKPLLVLKAPKRRVAQRVDPVAAPQPAKAVVAVAAPAPMPMPTPTPVVKAPKVVQAPPPAPKPAPISVVEAVEPPKMAVVKVPAVIAPPPPAPVAQVKAPMDLKPKAVVAAAPSPVVTPTTAPAMASTTVVDLPQKLTQAPAVASIPPSTGPLSDGDSMRIVFSADSSKLLQDSRDALKALSDRMQNQSGLRLQLLAYAGNADTSASAARRLSLSRALAVRSHLIESGVRSTRIDVRALGNKSSDTVTERVDITVVER